MSETTTKAAGSLTKVEAPRSLQDMERALALVVDRLRTVLRREDPACWIADADNQLAEIRRLRDIPTIASLVRAAEHTRSLTGNIFSGHPLDNWLDEVTAAVRATQRASDRFHEQLYAEAGRVARSEFEPVQEDGTDDNA